MGSYLSTDGHYLPIDWQANDHLLSSGFNSILYAVNGAKSRRKAEEMKEIKGGALSLIGMGSSIDSYFFLPVN